MLLAADAGNTNIKWAVFDGTSLKAQWRLRMQPERTADEYTALLFPLLDRAGITADAITGICLACVVPAALPALIRLFQTAFGLSPLIVSGHSDLGLTVSYQPPDSVGADRLADAVAAVQSYGAPCIVIDFGTATTFNAINSADTSGNDKPCYLGGAICLGIGISLEALYGKAAKIPPVTLAAPPQAIGGNTIHALQSGIIHGYAALVEGMVARFRDEMAAPDCPVIATGGHAELIAAETSCITAVVPELTLTGLRLVFERSLSGGMV